MNLINSILVAAAVIIIAFIVFVLVRRRRPIDTEKFQTRWKEVQKMCAKKSDWALAITDADKLLDEALKKRRIGGKSMGERMVKAQRLFSDNDGVWFAHKLRNKVESDPEAKLSENDVKSALVAFRQALKDLGALPK